MPLKFTKALAIIGLAVLAVFLVINQLGREPKNIIEPSTTIENSAANTSVQITNTTTQQPKITQHPIVNTTTSDVTNLNKQTSDIEVSDIETADLETADVETEIAEGSDLQSSNQTISNQEPQHLNTEEASNTENLIEGNIEDLAVKTEKVEAFCKEFAGKLRTVKYDGCMQLGLDIENKFQSVAGRSLTFRYFNSNNTVNAEDQGRILFISGIHGDEYSAISITYLWMLNMLKHEQENQQNWLFLPLSNPDGLFRSPATRINANDVDLNRNFPSPDWDELALDYWTKYYKKNRRRYPGPSANSEPETQWMVRLIKEFKPDAIISVHAPYGLSLIHI